MTDKIIIDGIDVSECRAYMPELGRDNCITFAHNGGSECEKSLDCYYKQLKRKEQECEKLEKTNTELAKYLMEIFELLCIDSCQSLLGYNCIEFYAVRSDTAINRIKELKHKEQELNKALREDNERLRFENE